MAETPSAPFPGLSAQEKTAVFIEGSDFVRSCRELGFKPTMPGLLTALKRSRDLVHVAFYRAVLPGEHGDAPMPSSFDGYEIKTRVGQVISRIGKRAVGDRVENVHLHRDSGLDVKMDIAEDMIDISYGKSPARVVLVSSTQDLASALGKVAKRGIRTSVVASHRTVTSTEHPLYVAADSFVSIADLRPIIEDRPSASSFMMMPPRMLIAPPELVA